MPKRANSPTVSVGDGYKPSRRSASGPARRSPTGNRRTDRTLSALIHEELWGDPQGVVDQSVPIGRIARKLVADLEDPDSRTDWHVLDMIWSREEGRIPDRIETEVTIKGVIALPVLRASEMDWAADAVPVLSAGLVRPPALPSPKQDDESE